MDEIEVNLSQVYLPTLRLGLRQTPSDFHEQSFGSLMED